MNCCPRALFMDLDGTVWSHLNISALDPPFTRISVDEISDATGVRVKLMDGVVEFLEWVRARGMVVASLSWNLEEVALAAIDAFGIGHLFDYHFIEYHPHKGVVMKKALERIEARLGEKVEACQIVYIDDRDIHVNEVRRLVGDVVFIHMWKTLRSYGEVKSFIKKLLRERCRPH